MKIDRSSFKRYKPVLIAEDSRGASFGYKLGSDQVTLQINDKKYCYSVTLSESEIVNAYNSIQESKKYKEKNLQID